MLVQQKLKPVVTLLISAISLFSVQLSFAQEVSTTTPVSKVQKFQGMVSISDPNVALQEIEITDYSTRIELLYSATNAPRGYCLLDAGSPNAFQLIDTSSQTIYPLQKLISPLPHCEETRLMTLFENETVEVQLFFPPLPADIKQVKLIEGPVSNTLTSAEFVPVDIVRQPAK